MATTFTRSDNHVLHFLGVINEKVFEKKPHTVDEWKDFTSQAFMDIDANQDCVLKCVTMLGTDSRNVSTLMEDIWDT